MTVRAEGERHQKAEASKSWLSFMSSTPKARIILDSFTGEEAHALRDLLGEGAEGEGAGGATEAATALVAAIQMQVNLVCFSLEAERGAPILVANLHATNVGAQYADGAFGTITSGFKSLSLEDKTAQGDHQPIQCGDVSQESQAVMILITPSAPSDSATEAP
jgi:hypothetical protein